MGTLDLRQLQSKRGRKGPYAVGGIERKGTFALIGEKKKKTEQGLGFPKAV